MRLGSLDSEGSLFNLGSENSLGAGAGGQWC